MMTKKKQWKTIGASAEGALILEKASLELSYKCGRKITKTEILDFLLLNTIKEAEKHFIKKKGKKN